MDKFKPGNFKPINGKYDGLFLDSKLAENFEHMNKLRRGLGFRCISFFIFYFVMFIYFILVITIAVSIFFFL